MLHIRDSSIQSISKDINCFIKEFVDFTVVHKLADQRVCLNLLSYFCRKIEQIYDQMRRLGMSVDWTRACFTLDEVCTGVVCLQIIVINFAYACDA